MGHDHASRHARLRQAVVRYLATHPLAADTADGILASWLPQTGFEYAPDHIAAVLEELVAKRWLLARELPDGKILYARGEALDRGT